MKTGDQDGWSKFHFGYHPISYMFLLIKVTPKCGIKVLVFREVFNPSIHVFKLKETLES